MTCITIYPPSARCYGENHDDSMQYNVLQWSCFLSIPLRTCWCFERYNYPLINYEEFIKVVLKLRHKKVWICPGDLVFKQIWHTFKGLKTLGCTYKIFLVFGLKVAHRILKDKMTFNLTLDFDNYSNLHLVCFLWTIFTFAWL